MQICILAKNENIEEVREKARQEVKEFEKHQTLLSVGLSSNGEKPITHWFCTFDASQEMIDKLKSIQELTEIEISNPRSFLKKNKLSSIKD